MELKAGSVIVSPSVNRRFNRTFMELKDSTTDGSCGRCISFNRTFMELKECTNFSKLDRFGFQSHLYGIERWCEIAWASVACMFQSHLYGIESEGIHGRIASRHQVSIAPLWNWKRKPTDFSVYGVESFNRTFMELKAEKPARLCCVERFQSHLYGIESYLSVNTPFKELRFNRTFMELKGGRRPVAHRPARVSIAPLWNWKISYRHRV